MNPVAEKLLWAIRYSLGWLPFFLLYVLGVYGSGRGSLPQVVYHTACYMAPGHLLGMAVWWYANRVGSKGHHWGKFFGLHLAAGVVYSILWNLLFFGLLFVVNKKGFHEFSYNQFIWMGLSGLMVYGILAGLASVDRLAKKVRERELNATKEESLRIRAEMEVLRGQLDPHFLFNTLHSITALVREDPVRAEEALLQFGGLLRHVISTKRSGADELPLREELAFIDRYLELEKLRLGTRLNVVRDHEQAALECWLPVFTVQPLVENAIKHAIAPHRQGGTLTLQSRLREGRLCITVSDNGPGTESSGVEKTTGVGLAAIKQRLLLRHHDAADMKIETSPGKGFSVTLVLPAVHNAVVDTVA